MNLSNVAAVKARAYVNQGRWIADCPNPACWNALALDPRQEVFHCLSPSGRDCCRQLFEIEWPADPDGITAELLRRPAAVNQNWFPAGHELAIRSGAPHGQTVADLRAETEIGLRETASMDAATEIMEPGAIPLTKLIGEGDL